MISHGTFSRQPVAGTSRRGSPTVDAPATIPTSVESPLRYLSVSLVDIGWLVAFGFVLGLAVALAVFVLSVMVTS